MLNQLPSEVKIVEVGPRDGLQNESQVIATPDKLSFIQKLDQAGLREIEFTSFVRPDRIAQMSDAKALMESIQAKRAKGELDKQGKRWPCLVPNMKGLEAALAAGVSEIAVFTATSETFNQHNINASIKESLKRIGPVMKEAIKNGLEVRGYISTVFGCPYEGATSSKKALELTEQLLKWGAYEISLGDTIGVAEPRQVQQIVAEITQSVSSDSLALHFHDTRGRALANVLAGLDGGIRIFDASAGGLGGCPYARGATGNVATEDVVDFLESLGVKTGVSLEKLVAASEFMACKLKKVPQSKVYHAFKAQGATGER